ncbi:MAG: hypothetical protein M3376_03515 [Actinomycetota bacterium]|nr:hypothetical protein [Actinomycetota bacterium]
MSTIASPVPHAQQVDDDDYEYVWSAGGLDLPLPRWLADIVDVQPMVRLEIFLFGLCAGLVIALITLFAAFYFAAG